MPSARPRVRRPERPSRWFPQPRIAGLFFWGAVSVAVPLLLPLPARASSCEATVERVHDGDTLTLRCPERRFKLRLQGIDAPELGQPYGREAREALGRRLAGRSVAVESRAIDAYERVIGRARVDGASLELWLVAEGWAWCARRATAECRRVQARARSGRRGLWAESEPIPPWTWRAAHPRAAGGASGRPATHR